ncbi:TPA: hypothetical protein ACXDAY_002836 [Clostridium botulinum]|jgi:hypothetical protein|uniref:hypothetical protein n=1 Tax=Clostridium botulinum TaxID=1491 RepID=UPI0004048BAB|nr:hypothetical protein [Clostridium botulinum]MBY6907419.1 hypothetical protein [Clostridium botulinum]MBY6927731.1 hypothetical protein [Clostridium botulinum]MBY6955107.1 hypothetical protein [Clostridium botulinum]MBY6965290.1 hypothetical protein [Clostridium botulinum]MCR1178805.1 hypothetical protein [Clostridium botulinum]
MRAEMVISSIDYDILVYDDLNLSFYDKDTETKVQVVLPEHIAKKFKEELNKKL